jgi:hypothetical protein
MANQDDWRLSRPRKYLQGIELQWEKFIPYREEYDSDHCEFCWAKFMDAVHPDFLREGYTTPNHYYWICKNCFEDFRDLFQWKVRTHP